MDEFIMSTLKSGTVECTVLHGKDQCVQGHLSSELLNNPAEG